MSPAATTELPSAVATELDRFVAAVRDAFSDDLVSIVLFGSAAEGRLRPASDVNLIVVLRRFDAMRADAVRAAYRIAQAAVRLEAMFLLEEEVVPAVEEFAVKFADVIGRRRVLHGHDPFEGRTIDPAALRRQLRQVLLNLVLRARERYLVVSLRDEQLALVISDLAGPLRAAAAALRSLEGQPPLPPKEALAAFVASDAMPEGEALLGRISQAREQGSLPPGVGAPVLLGLIGLARRMHARAGGGATP